MIVQEDWACVVSMRLGARIARLRRERGLSQGDLAIRASVSRDVIAGLEDGSRLVAAADLWPIARALKVSIDSFFPARAPDNPHLSLARPEKAVSWKGLG